MTRGALVWCMQHFAILCRNATSKTLFSLPVSTHRPRALRGGGHQNFGVVTGLTYRIFPQDQLLIWNATWDAAADPQVQARVGNGHMFATIWSSFLVLLGGAGPETTQLSKPG